MSEDMSDMIQKMSEMLKNNEIPDNIKSIMNNLASQSNSEGSSNSTREQDIKNNYDKNDSNYDHKSSQSNTNSESNSDTFDIPNIDFNTMLKMKSVIDSMNKQQNDPRSNLLKSLKPYLKPSRKEKVDQYIKLFSMGKVFEVLNPLGGEKKNDV